MKLLGEVLDYVGVVLLLFNFIVFLTSYKRHKHNKSYAFFTLYLLVTLIIQVWSFYLAHQSSNNLFLSHAYFISQFVLLSLFYREMFPKLQKKYVVVVLVSVLTFLLIRFSINPKLLYGFDLVEVFICSLPLVVYAFMHLYNSLNEPKAFLYINGGILVFLSASTLIFILGNYLTAQNINDAIRGIWMVNAILYLVFLILIFIEWFKNYRPIKQK